MELLIIGLDALDPFLIEEYLDELPMFRYLRKNAEWHIVRCDAEIPNTSSGWASIYTGKLTKEHGFLCWNNFGEEDEWLGVARKLEGKFWDRLNAAGYSVGILNPPMVWPARMENGWCVGGFPDPLYHYRLIKDGRGEFDLVAKGLYSSEEVAALAPPRYIVDAQGYKDRRMVLEDWKAWYLPEIKSLARIRLSFGLRLFRELPVDVGFICLTFLDRLGHASNHLMKNNCRDKAFAVEEMRRAYRLADRMVRELLEEVKPKNFIICADHGHNFSTVTPALRGSGQVIGEPNWLGHTWVTVGFAGGEDVEPSEGEERQLTWVFNKIFELLNIEVPDVENGSHESVFTKEEEAIAKSRLEGLGYV